MPMQPRPIAETSGPFLPSRRLLTWNIPFSFSDTEPPPRLREIKWDRDPFVTRCCPGNNRHFGTAEPECLREQLHDGVVGGTVGRTLRHSNFQLLASVAGRAPAPD